MSTVWARSLCSRIGQKLRYFGDFLDARHVFKWFALLGGIVAIIQFTFVARSNIQQAQFQAWNILNNSVQVRGSGGRVLALERLNNDQVPLREVQLHGANITQVRLAGAQLEKANLDDATVDYGQFRGANLQGASARGATMKWTCLASAELAEIKLVGASLYNSDLRGANLRKADLTGTDLTGAILDKADLTGANLTNASIGSASLQGVNLSGAILENLRSWKTASNLEGIIYRGAYSVPEGLGDALNAKGGIGDNYRITIEKWQEGRDRLKYTAVGVCDQR